jgi:hypothetical protein
MRVVVDFLREVVDRVLDAVVLALLPEQVVIVYALGHDTP